MAQPAKTSLTMLITIVIMYNNYCNTIVLTKLEKYAILKTRIVGGVNDGRATCIKGLEDTCG